MSMGNRGGQAIKERREKQQAEKHNEVSAGFFDNVHIL
jgi:hypothetical protein